MALQNNKKKLKISKTQFFSDNYLETNRPKKFKKKLNAYYHQLLIENIFKKK